MPRRTTTSREAADAAFKAVTRKPAELPSRRAICAGSEKDSIVARIDRDVLDYFQEAGPGWQDRINEVLRKAAGK